jgi:hypothetical protein
MSARRPDEWLVEVPCVACGARDFEVIRPGWTEGLRDWLRFGGPWRPPRRVCRHCGDTSDSRSYATLAPSRRGWWWLPVELFRAVRRRRGMIPVPATYLGAVVAGAALGVAAQLAFGWPWWLVAAGGVAAVWLFFLSSAFWGAGGSDQPLATDLLWVVRPDRALERDHRRQVERFLAAPFPLYGLPSAWPGARHLGGWAGRWTKGQGPVTTALSLGHGDPLTDQGPQLRVEVSVEQVDSDPVELLAATRRRPEPAWSPVTIPVDGRLVGFEWLGEGRHWVARAELADHTLTLYARDLPVESVELVRVADLEPYIQGARGLQEAWARLHDQER